LLSTCLIDNRAFVGEGCIILEHSWVAEYAMLAPGSVLQPFSYIPPGQVWAGNPARYVRDVEEDEKQFIRDTAQESHDLGNAHADEYALEYPMVRATSCTARPPTIA
jgi:carbonic anhydrase/acetyltransferase-like protein (isoleucine patch superfamily)